MPTMQWGKAREIEFSYQAREEAWFDPTRGIGSPGCDEEIEIVGIMVKFPGYEDFDLLGEGVLPEEVQGFLMAEAEEFVWGWIRDERERAEP